MTTDNTCLNLKFFFEKFQVGNFVISGPKRRIRFFKDFLIDIIPIDYFLSQVFAQFLCQVQHNSFLLHPYHRTTPSKVGCVFSMVIWPEFRMDQYTQPYEPNRMLNIPFD